MNAVTKKEAEDQEEFNFALEELKHFVKICFEQLGLNHLAKDVSNITTWSKLKHYARIAEIKARVIKDLDALETLWAFNLIQKNWMRGFV